MNANSPNAGNIAITQQKQKEVPIWRTVLMDDVKSKCHICWRVICVMKWGQVAFLSVLIRKCCDLSRPTLPLGCITDTKQWKLLSCSSAEHLRFCTHIKQTVPDYFPAACLLWLIKCLVILFQSVSDWLVLSYIPCSVCTLENSVCNLRLPTTCWLFLFTPWRQYEATLTFYGSADGKDLKIVIFFWPHSSNTHQGFVNYPWSEILDGTLVKVKLVKPSFSQPSPTFDLSSKRAKVSVSSLWGIAFPPSHPPQLSSAWRVHFPRETVNVIEVSAAGIFGLQRLREQQVVPPPVMEVSFSLM